MDPHAPLPLLSNETTTNSRLQAGGTMEDHQEKPKPVTTTADIGGANRRHDQNPPMLPEEIVEILRFELARITDQAKELECLVGDSVAPDNLLMKQLRNIHADYSKIKEKVRHLKLDAAKGDKDLQTKVWDLLAPFDIEKKILEIIVERICLINEKLGLEVRLDALDLKEWKLEKAIKNFIDPSAVTRSLSLDSTT